MICAHAVGWRIILVGVLVGVQLVSARKCPFYSTPVSIACSVLYLLPAPSDMLLAFFRASGGQIDSLVWRPARQGQQSFVQMNVAGERMPT